MVQFTATIAQFAAQGEKTGWTYIVVPADVAEQMNPGVRKSYRVKGKLDAHPIKSVAIMPMGGGEFILPVNATMRKAIHKKKGAMVKVQLQIDQAPLELPPGFMECLDDEPKAKKAFDALKLSHRNYFIKWMGGVKGEAARAKRITMVINALLKGYGFAEMFQEQKKEREGY
jgi:hypothetical protein